MIKVEVKGVEAVKAHLAGMGRQVAYAASRAINATAKKVADTMPAEIERSIDRPTAFTKRGVRVLRYANKGNLEATVGFMDAQARYMRLQIEGGTRQAGPRGIKIPGNITLNAFGNIPKGVIDQLKAAAKGGGLSKTIARRLQASGERRKAAAPVELFFGKPKGKGWEKAPVGIYRRVPGSPGKLVPVVLFEDTPVKYKPRFDFRRKAEAVVQREWQAQFALAMAEAMRTAR
jgi:hypothetical protein